MHFLFLRELIRALHPQAGLPRGRATNQPRSACRTRGEREAATLCTRLCFLPRPLSTSAISHVRVRYAIVLLLYVCAGQRNTTLQGDAITYLRPLRLTANCEINRPPIALSAGASVQPCAVIFWRTSHAAISRCPESAQTPESAWVSERRIKSSPITVLRRFTMCSVLAVMSSVYVL